MKLRFVDMSCQRRRFVGNTVGLYVGVQANKNIHHPIINVIYAEGPELGLIVKIAQGSKEVKPQLKVYILDEASGPLLVFTFTTKDVSVDDLADFDTTDCKVHPVRKGMDLVIVGAGELSPVVMEDFNLQMEDVGYFRLRIGYIGFTGNPAILWYSDIQKGEVHKGLPDSVRQDVGLRRVQNMY